jgi:hypothetical protein
MNKATQTFLLVSAAYLFGNGSTAFAEAQSRIFLEDRVTEDLSETQSQGSGQRRSARAMIEAKRTLPDNPNKDRQGGVRA